MIPSRIPGRWRVWAYDLLSGRQLGLVPLRQLRWKRSLNSVGDLSGTILLGDPRIAVQDPISLTEPARTLLVVDRAGTVMWAGIVWQRRKQRGGYGVDVSADEIASWLDRKAWITDPLSWTQADQLEIARGLVAYALAKPGGGLPILFDDTSSGVLRDASWPGDGTKSVWSALIDLATADDGFDVSIDSTWGGDGLPQHTLTLGWPHRGRTAATTDLLWELGANLVDYEWDEDGDQIVDSVLVTGDAGGDGTSTPLRSQADNTDLLSAGYPRLEKVESYAGGHGAADQATLDRRAAAILAAGAKPVVLPTIVVRPDVEPQLGSYSVGDHCRLRIDDPRFPDGMDSIWRITEMEVSVGDNEEETVELTLGQAV